MASYVVPKPASKNIPYSTNVTQPAFTKTFSDWLMVNGIPTSFGGNYQNVTDHTLYTVPTDYVFFIVAFGGYWKNFGALTRICWIKFNTHYVLQQFAVAQTIAGDTTMGGQTISLPIPFRLEPNQKIKIETLTISIDFTVWVYGYLIQKSKLDREFL
jgi:hypothetical protein